MLTLLHLMKWFVQTITVVKSKERAALFFLKKIGSFFLNV
jgi:hypothetical protein